MEAAYRTTQRAETCTILSYRVGVLLLIIAGALLIAGLVFVISDFIDTVYLSRNF